MSAEPYSASLVQRFAVPTCEQSLQVYYRSKLFIAASTSNPLVAAAGPLFALLERLCVSPTLPPITAIHDNIAHELLAYRSRLQQVKYAGEIAGIAHYLLCATLDELLGKSYMRIHGKYAEFKAFTPPSTDGAGPEKRFFDIVQHIKEHANQYLDLIELSYYCLIAGFEGEQHVRTDGRQTLEHLTEELYQLIQKHRVHKPYRLFKPQATNTTAPINHAKQHNLYTLGLSGVALLAIVSAYFTSNSIINHHAQNLLPATTFTTLEP